MEHARYLIRGDDNRWRAVKLQDYRVATGKTPPATGLLEVLAQHVTAHWEIPGESCHYSLLLPPKVLEATSATVLMRACDEAFSDFSIAGLHRIAVKTEVFILAEVPDNAKSNGLKKAAMATKLPRNCLYLASLGCTVHRVHRIFEAAIDHIAFLGDVHAISTVCGVPRYRRQMHSALRALVAEELELLAVPNPAHQAL